MYMVALPRCGRRPLLSARKSVPFLLHARTSALLVQVPTPLPTHNPPSGWHAVQRWRDKSLDAEHAKDCSALVRTARRALRPAPGTRPARQKFWRWVAARGGQLCAHFGPLEMCGLLTTLADAKLRWQDHAACRDGLRQFAEHAAQEIGSFSPDQLSELVSAFARLGFHHEGLMQSVSLAVESAVRLERTRFDNSSVCIVLDAYRRLGLLDEAVMKHLSKLICRRQVRQPFDAQQTATMVVAFAELRARDLAFFNSTTLALCRPHAIAALNWSELADVAYAYASLRLDSPTLSSKIWSRVWESASVEFSTYDSSAGQASPCLSGLEQMREPVPPEPPARLPPHAVVKLLEALMCLGRISPVDLQPLLPHLAHPTSKPSTAAAVSLTIALCRGGHLWPWLWTWTAPAFSDDRLRPSSLVPLLEALRHHISNLERTLDGPRLLSETNPHAAPLGDFAPMIDDHTSALPRHLMVVSAYISKIWPRLASHCSCLSDSDLKCVASLVPDLVEKYSMMQRFLSRWDDTHGEQMALSESRVKAVARRVGAELVSRKVTTTGQVMDELLSCCGDTASEAEAEAKRSAWDSIHVPWTGAEDFESTATDCDASL